MTAISLSPRQQMSLNVSRALAEVRLNSAHFKNTPYSRDGHRIGPGVRTIDSIMSHPGYFYHVMRRPPSAGRHYSDYIITRQMKRYLARLTAKRQRHNDYLAGRRGSLSGRKATR